MKYASVDQLKTYLGLKTGDSEPTIEVILDLVSAGLEDYMGISFVKATRTKVMHPEGTFFYVNPYPIDLTASYVLLDGDYEVPKLDYIITADSGRVQLKYGEFGYKQYPSVSFTWTGGYKEDGTGNGKRVQVPDVLVRACILQAAYEFKNKDHLGLSAIALGGGSVQLAPAKLLPAVTEILDGVVGMLHV